MKERYMGLYDYMAHSRDPKNMKAFGCVMTEMMDYLIANKPDVAANLLTDGLVWLARRLFSR